MFNCNSLTLLNFTYYLKVILGYGMTIIPFIIIFIAVIKFIRAKSLNKKINKIFLKKEAKLIFYALASFLLSFSLHNVINKPDNKCYMYSKPEIINQYKTNLKEVNASDLSDTIKVKYMENVLLTAYKEYNHIENNDDKPKKDILLHENDLTKQNKVYVKNGVFYYQGYNGNYNTYTGTSCPSNPLKEGYNNPYGYNNYFYNRLVKFIDDAKSHGYKITMSSQGCRSYQTQVNYYNTMERGRAAKPGYSMHGLGIASDLEFYKANGEVCPYGRTDSSCPSMGWAHQNAYKYGLTFPLLYASYKEDWHIEPVNKQAY